MLTHLEVMAILGAVAGDTPIHLRDRAVLDVLYSSGIRREELVHLSASNDGRTRQGPVTAVGCAPMKRRYRLYLETSFRDRLADSARPEARRLSYLFLNRACRNHDILISPLVVREVHRTPDFNERRQIERHMRTAYRHLVPAKRQAEAVADQLQQGGSFGEKMFADLTHLGYAVLGRADAVVTWNMRTLARTKVRLAVDAFCRRQGFVAPLIGTPTEVAQWLELLM